jgi:transketolase
MDFPVRIIFFLNIILHMNATQKIANALRVLSIDAVFHANSGHPGMPLGMADIAAVLWTHFLKFNGINPLWFNRDRFILSNGHGSMLHYALLHLFGYNMQLEDIKQFRQLHSRTPGHPERNHTPGIEVTTGPLSQGLANAVGMALAEKQLGLKFNETQLAPIVDHYTYVFLGDGCLMEGLSHESASFAGEYQLNKLIAFYDCNGITIDGQAPQNIKAETIARFHGYGWQVLEIDGHDHQAIFEAIEKSQQEKTKPSLIICHTKIGLGSKLEGQAKVHGSPLDAEDMTQLKAKLDWHYPPFKVPDEIYALINLDEGQQAENQWIQTCFDYMQKDAQAYSEFLRRINGDLPDNWSKIKSQLFQKATEFKQAVATRQSSQYCLEYLIPELPELIGGSADLTPSNNTKVKTSQEIQIQESGNYIHYGVREFGMAAIMNGLAAHQGFIPYGGTFLVFADYARNAIRMSAMMELKVIYVLTHDSVFLGEDGPTHQPIEHLAMLRYTPKLRVWRPASNLETAVAWAESIEYTGASCIILSRQNLNEFKQTTSDAEMIRKGAYIVYENHKSPDIILMATGSELGLAIEAAHLLQQEDIRVRVVSMPNPEVFLQQSEEYRESVLPNAIRNRIAIEAAQKAYWYQFVGLDGAILGLSDFGASAPAEDVRTAFELDLPSVIKASKQLLLKNGMMPVN